MCWLPVSTTERRRTDVGRRVDVMIAAPRQPHRLLCRIRGCDVSVLRATESDQIWRQENSRCDHGTPVIGKRRPPADVHPSARGASPGRPVETNAVGPWTSKPHRIRIAFGCVVSERPEPLVDDTRCQLARCLGDARKRYSSPLLNCRHLSGKWTGSHQPTLHLLSEAVVSRCATKLTARTGRFAPPSSPSITVNASGV